MGVANNSPAYISQIIALQRDFFRSGATLDIAFREEMLRRLLDGIRKWEQPLAEALWRDLHKSYEEAYLTEFGILYAEIRNHLKHLRSWAKPKRTGGSLKSFPSRSKVVSEPLGNTLIIAPWNYPVQLLLNPLIAAISAGCTALLKPSPYTPNVSQALENMVADTFPEMYVAVVQGNRDVNRFLLGERFDLIFFTGSPVLGKEVMAAAAKNLTPVILELGGKSPCIVDKEADIAVAAKRIAWGKSLNAGQTCIAPDYLLIHEDVKEAFVEALQKAFTELLTAEPRTFKHFVRIVSDRAFDRLVAYLDDGEIRFGGDSCREERFIAPTLLENVSPDAPVMQEEIFGPIFPLLTFKDTDQAITFVSEREKPLALYYFGSKEKGDEVLRRTSSGGACVNDVIMHIANENTPFGGVGNSGMGSYHGRDGFDAFSHRKTVLSTTTLFDVPFRYMPYKLFSLIKKMM